MEVEDILSDLIKIKSVNPPGGEMEVARYLKRLFDQAQVQSEIIESSPGRGNLIAGLGEGDRRLLYLSHTDVVPATEDWDFDPFSGEIRDGFVHGRGALDCKGLVAAEAYAMIHLAKDFKPQGRLIFAATADEEIGGREGVEYLIQRFKDKLAADFVINEGGGEPIKIDGKSAYFIQTGEKGSAWAELKARGLACHGSVPGLGDNAVVKMAAAVRNLAEYKPQVILIPEVKRLVQELARIKGLDIQIAEDNIDLLIQAIEDRALAAYLRAVTRMTVSPNVIHGGLKTNVVPDSCQAEVDIRVLPGQDEGYIIRELTRAIGADIEINIPNYSAASFSPPDGEHYRLIADTIGEVVADAVSLPFVSSGATDSRLLRRIGIPCYGLAVLSRDFDSSLIQSVHGRNERIDIESLRVESEFLIRLAQNYLSTSS